MSTFENKGSKIRKLAHAINSNFPEKGDGFNDEGEALDSIAESIDAGWGKLPTILNNNKFLVSKKESGTPTGTLPEEGSYFTKALIYTHPTTADFAVLPYNDRYYWTLTTTLDTSEVPQDILNEMDYIAVPFYFNVVPVSETECLYTLGMEHIQILFNTLNKTVEMEGLVIQPGAYKFIVDSSTLEFNLEYITEDVFDLYDWLCEELAAVSTSFTKTDFKNAFSKVKIKEINTDYDSVKHIISYNNDFVFASGVTEPVWKDLEEAAHIPHLYLHNVMDNTELVSWDIISNNATPYTSNLDICDHFLIPTADHAILSVSSLDFESSVVKITQDHSTNAITIYYFTTTGIASYNLSNNLTDTVTKLQ